MMRIAAALALGCLAGLVAVWVLLSYVDIEPPTI